MKLLFIRLNLLILLCSMILLASISSCKTKSVRIDFSYDYMNPQINHYPDTITKDTACLLFSDGYDSDRVKVYLNGHKIYSEKITDNRIAGPAGDLYFKKEKENILQIQIDGNKTQEFRFDNKYNRAMVKWNNDSLQLKFIYQNYIFLFD